MNELLHFIWQAFLACTAFMLATAVIYLFFRVIMLGYSIVQWVEDGILEYVRSRKYLEDKVDRWDR